MPIKWSAQLDQVLLTQIIKIKGITLSSPDAQKIIDAWPDDQGDKPTVRALQEHIRALIKSSNNYLVGLTPATPRKPTPRKANTAKSTPRTPASKNKKRKHSKLNDDDDSDDALSGSDLDLAARGSPSPPVKRAQRAASQRSKSIMAEVLARELETSESEEQDDDDEEEEEEEGDGEKDGEEGTDGEKVAGARPAKKMRTVSPEDSGDDYVQPDDGDEEGDAEEVVVKREPRDEDPVV